MNLFELFVKIGAKDEASDKLRGISNLAGSVGKGLATAAKFTGVAVGAAATGISALTKSAVDNYAEYEQLVGGVETLFGSGGKTLEEYAESVGKTAEEVKKQYNNLMTAQEGVFEDAKNAYVTAGMSANEYMNTVTSFSASLIQSLGGDTMDAAAYANMAVVDMADNANKMGTSIDMIQNAYQGFAKQNYTMLDNLKLGYGGTAREMARLVNESGVLSEEQKINLDDTKHLGEALSEVGFSKIVEAIHAVQEQMGITGTTALEAGRTISGSVGSMKSAWQNLLTGLADGTADTGALVDNLVTTIVGDGTESNLGVLGNILPAAETAISGIARLIEQAAPIFISLLPGLIEQIVPSLISAAMSMVNGVVAVLPGLLTTIIDALITNAPMLIVAAVSMLETILSALSSNQELVVASALQIVEQLIDGALGLLPELFALGLDLLISIANGIAGSLPELVPVAVSVIAQLVNTLTDPNTLSALLDAALAVILALADALVVVLPQLISATVLIIERLIEFLLEPENIEKLAVAAVQIVVALAEGLVKSVGALLGAVGSLISKVTEKFKKTDWGKVGKDIVNGIWEGLKQMWKNLEKWFDGQWNKLVGGVKELLGIHSPSRVFAGIGKNMVLGLEEGWDDEFADAEKAINGDMDFDKGSIDFENSAIGASSAGVIGGLSAGLDAGYGEYTINLMLPDGTKLASYLLDPLTAFANANGTPILNPR